MGDYLNQQVRKKHIHFIVTEICAHTECVTRKEELLGAFGLPPDADLDNKYRLDGCNSYNYFQGVLSKWINSTENTASTLDLNKALRSIEWNAAADNLKEKWFEKICSTVKIPNTSAVHGQNTKILKDKWWPVEKDLVESFQQRKSDGILYVKKLRNMLKENQDGRAVINQKVAVSGFGGVGKTTTANWYAIHYQDKYDHILWIDCGEGSLLKSFSELARELKIASQEDLRLTSLARECFNILEKKKCLWIFDNAERYVGTEGIKDVLPRNANFHSIITSRNCKWGSRTGYGEIPTFPLDAFTLEESIDFLTKNLEQETPFHSDPFHTDPFHTDPFHTDELEQLCELLGNLPLALQIAVATMNKQELSLAAYIKIIECTDAIINSSEFDDYEKTINSTLTISLDFIKSCQYDSNQLAYQILLSFGYIQPDDVEAQFFECVQKTSACDIQVAVALLEQYSLVSKEKKWTNSGGIYSIHRLLQQVIRYYCKSTSSEIDTITKILNCSDHYEYKLAPYTFAPDDLKNKFPRVRATLIDQIQLPKLILERKFTDALQLSDIIQRTLRSSSSAFNYAVCLRKLRKFEVAVEIFEALYDEVQDKPTPTHSSTDPETDLLPLEVTPDKGAVGSQLFCCYLQIGRFKNAEIALETVRRVTMSRCEETLNSVLTFLGHDDQPGLKAYPIFLLDVIQQNISLSIYRDRDNDEFKLMSFFCSLQPAITVDRTTLNDSEIRIPEHTKSLQMTQFDFHHSGQLEYSRVVNLSHFVPSEMLKLEVDCRSPSNRHTENNLLLLTCNALVPYTNLIKIQSLELRGCNIEIDGELFPQELLSPKTLHLENVHFVHEGKNMNKMLLNQFVNFAGATHITVVGFSSEILYIGAMDHSEEEVSNLMSEINPKRVYKIEHVEHTLEMSGNLTLESVKLCGSGIKIVHWGNSNWDIGRLVLNQVHLENNQLKVRELKVKKISLDLALIPATVEKLTLGWETSLVVSDSERVQQFTLPNLKFLHVQLCSRSSYDFVHIMDTCTNVVTVILENREFKFAEIDFSVFPKTVQTIKLRGIEMANANACTEVTPLCVDKLILYKYRVSKAINVLTHVKPKRLVYCKIYNVPEYDLGKIIDFSRSCMDCECIFIGPLRWKNFVKSRLSSHVDKEAKFYLFKNQNGTAIEESLFLEEGMFSKTILHFC